MRSASTIHLRAPFLFMSSHLALLIGSLIWFSPITHEWCQRLDQYTFLALNGTLEHNAGLQTFWGILNHRRETSYNLIIAALFNLWALLTTRDRILRSTRGKQLLYFWLCFQIGFMLQDHLFNTLLKVLRDSPSLVLNPVIQLSTVLQDKNIKDFSAHSFPSGHAFSLIYWSGFSLLCSPKKIGALGLVLAVFFCLPRLVSGAHWMSDTLFSGMLALVWLSWSVNTPIYYAIMKRLQPLNISRQPHEYH